MAESNQLNDGNILSSLIALSEKAANIARICRKDDHLLSLLVQEKKESEKNPRYVQDFKTLADVLVQEVVKHELGKKFPALIGHIYGEENNEFVLENECVIIEIKSNMQETTELLSKVLPDPEASRVLAEVIHTETDDIDCDIRIPDLPDSLGIWIDPIDSTAEYIAGKDGVQDGKVRNGLPCVTVLIGVFDRNTGEPIIGVINQPFYKNEQDTWIGRYVFGVSINDFNVTRPEYFLDVQEKLVAVSSSEDDEIKNKLTENGYNIIEIAGAGSKLLSIILGEVYAYVLSKPTTYMWDICAGHAILRSLGGDIIEYSSLKPIKYTGTVGIKDSCNSAGIIAFRDLSIKDNIIDVLGLKDEGISKL
ncbi:hypothetical protein O3M35_010778 [Rhynocoris fuscipes]